MLPCSVAGFYITATTMKDTVQTGRGETKEEEAGKGSRNISSTRCVRLSASGNCERQFLLRLSLPNTDRQTHTLCIFYMSYLLQQFVFFCLQHEGEIITVRGLLGTLSFLLFQISYHLSNTQPDETTA